MSIISLQILRLIGEPLISESERLLMDCSSVIAMYQKRAFQDTGQIRDRCIHACNSIASTSSLVVNRVQLVGPHNLLGFFVAARFLSGTLHSPLISDLCR